MSIPLSHVLDLEITVAAPIVVGETQGALRRVIPITGGTVKGSGLTGRILPAGADFQLIYPDGYTLLEAKYVIEASDGALIYVDNRGIRYGAPEVMRRLAAGEAVDPGLVYFRSTPRFETAAPPYSFLTRPLFIASGIRRPDRVELAVYEVK